MTDARALALSRRQARLSALGLGISVESMGRKAFAAVGMEGEARWRAAAQVRILLAHPPVSTASVRSAALWADPDIRWLAGVNTSAGITYIHREQFEELLAWLQLPILIQLAQQPSGQTKSVAELEAIYGATCERAHAAGYKLDDFLTPIKPVPVTQLAATAKP